MSAIKRGYVQVGRLQIHYRLTGTRGAPLMVLLHQSPSDSQMYGPLMQRLADRYELLAPDTPGFGGSDALSGGFTIPAAASALRAAVKLLRPGAHCWFGHHTGAALALQVAATHPEQVRRLALSGPCLLDQAMKERLPTLAPPVEITSDGRHLLALWARLAAKDAEADPGWVQRELVAALRAGDHYSQAYRAVTEVDTEAQLRGLHCPTLVFAGTEDPLYPQLEAAHRLLPDGLRLAIPGARSTVCEREADTVAALLDDFFGVAGG